VISESGIKTRADLERLEAAGVKGVLVGESLMRAPDVGAALAALRGNHPVATSRRRGWGTTACQLGLVRPTGHGGVGRRNDRRR